MKLLPKFLTTDEFKALLEKPNPRTDEGLRDWCILRLFAETGIRCAELVSLKLSDFDFDRRSVRIMGKGKKERIAFISQELIRKLESFMRRTQGRSIDGIIFDISDRTVRRMVKRYGKKAKITKDIHPHLLRHTFASVYLEANPGDIVGLQKLMGHAWLTTTQIYTHVTDTKLQERTEIYRAKLPKAK